MDDQQIADVLSYVRSAWGNKADPVSVDAVAALREASAARSTPWTAEELEAVPFDRGYGRYTGKYSVSFVTFEPAFLRGVPILMRDDGTLVLADAQHEYVYTPVE